METAGHAPRKKKLPFKRTIPRRKSPDPFSDDLKAGVAGFGTREDSDDDDGISMFRRSNEVFPLAVEEEQHRWEKEEVRGKKGAADKSELEEQSPKRRRVSGDLSGDEDDGPRRVSSTRHRPKRSSTPRSAGVSSQREARTSSPPHEAIENLRADGRGLSQHEHSPSPTASRTRVFKATRASMRVRASQPTADLDGSHVGRGSEFGASDARRTDSKVAKSASPIPVVVDDNTSVSNHSTPEVAEPPEVAFGGNEPEDEFSKYVHQAREREARANSARASTVEPAQDLREDLQAADSCRTHARLADAVIRVMVTSLLPDTTTMLAKIKLTQRLGVVRDTWIAHQKKKATPIPDEVAERVFLTWKERRIYNTVTCVSLGIELDTWGKVQRDPKSMDDAGYAGGGLHFQAWTEEVYTKHIKDKERDRMLSLGELDEDDVRADDEPSTAEAAGGQGKLIRVIIKARDYDAVNTKVHPHTTVDTMLSVFRDLRQVPPEKETIMFFDGEPLDPDMTVAGADLEDMDSLEIHIK